MDTKLQKTNLERLYLRLANRDSIAELQEGGFYPVPAKQVKADAPPVPGARLGRDQAGNPAWYIADPKDPAKFVPVK